MTYLKCDALYRWDQAQHLHFFTNLAHTQIYIHHHKGSTTQWSIHVLGYKSHFTLKFASLGPHLLQPDRACTFWWAIVYLWFTSSMSSTAFSLHGASRQLDTQTQPINGWVPHTTDVGHTCNHTCLKYVSRPQRDTHKNPRMKKGRKKER